MRKIIIASLVFLSLNVYSQKPTITEYQLKNGYTVIGVIIDSVPNKSYTIRTLKGIEQTYAWDEIEIIPKIKGEKDKKKKEDKSIIFKLNKADLGLDYGFVHTNGKYLQTQDRIGLYAQFYLTDNFVIGMSGAKQNFNMEKTIDWATFSPTGRFSSWSYGFSFKQHLSKRKLSPFVCIEFGKMHWSYDGIVQVVEFQTWNNSNKTEKNIVVEGDNVFFAPIFGLAYKINNKFNVNLSARYSFDINNHNLTKIITEEYIYKFNNQKIIETLNSDSKFNMLSVNLGISFSIWSKK